jgi:hypothetical protein
LQAYRILVSKQRGGRVVDVSVTPEDAVRQLRTLIDARASGRPDLRLVHTEPGSSAS